MEGKGVCSGLGKQVLYHCSWPNAHHVKSLPGHAMHLGFLKVVVYVVARKASFFMFVSSFMADRYKDLYLDLDLTFFLYE